MQNFTTIVSNNRKILIKHFNDMTKARLEVKVQIIQNLKHCYFSSSKKIRIFPVNIKIFTVAGGGGEINS